MWFCIGVITSLLQKNREVFSVHHQIIKNLDEEATTKHSIDSVKKYINNFSRPPGKSLFGISDKFGIKILTKIRVDFSDLTEHRFPHTFKCKSSVRRCELDDETHYFQRCTMFALEHTTLLSKIPDSSFWYFCSSCSVLPDDHYFKL